MWGAGRYRGDRNRLHLELKALKLEEGPLHSSLGVRFISLYFWVCLKFSRRELMWSWCGQAGIFLAGLAAWMGPGGKSRLGPCWGRGWSLSSPSLYDCLVTAGTVLGPCVPSAQCRTWPTVGI